MDGHVLGPVSVEVTGRKGAVGTTKVAALFGLLVTSPGCRCSRQEIAEVLWEGEEGVGDRVDWVVRELRKRLGKDFVPHGGKSGFCTLRVPAGSVDYLRFLEGWRRAALLPLPERFEQLRAALEEWEEDEPLRGLIESGFRVRRERMRAERIAAVCDLLEAAWRSGKQKWFREESEKWYARSPRHPRIFQYYLIAHGWDMPEREFDRLINQWRRHSGAPDAELQSVIDRLRGEAPRSGGTVLLPIPDQLPAEERRPVGQEDLVSALVDVVCEEQDVGRTALVLLSGMPGVGKSTVALHVARQLRERFPDGVLYTELNGFIDGEVRPTEPEQVLDGFLAALPPYSTVTGVQGKSAALRSALANRSALFVLDDAFNTKQVLPLLPGVGTCAVIITSRDELGGLCAQKRVHSHRMKLLRDEAALEVLQERVSEKDRSKYAVAFAELVRLCGNLPLALTVVERRLRDRPLQIIHGLVREMKKERARLDALHLPEHDMSVRVALNSSVRALSEEARMLLWQLALHPGPSVAWEAVMDLGAESEAMHADRVLGELVAANLVELHTDRYRLHDLVRAFARHHIPAPLGDEEAFEKATVRQVLEHQLQNVRACDRLLDRQRTLPIGEPDGVKVTDLADTQHALELLDKEYDTIRRGIELAVSQGAERYIWLLPMALVTYQWRRGRLTDALNDLGRAAEVAETAASPVDCAMVYRMLAGTRWRLEEFELAAGNLRRAVRLSRQDESERGRLSLARSLYALGITLRKQDRGTPAEENLRQSLALYREVLDPVGEAAALNGIGALHYDRGEYGEALHWCADALSVVERTVDRRGRADVLFTLAKVHVARYERDEAIALYRQACDIYQEQEYWPDEDKARRLFADVLVSAGSSQEAVEELERVLVLREQMGGTDVQEIRELLEGLR
ncbi:SARP-family transcriptional regulator [Streptomyces sp. L-9-10]|uniref:AfsR/SARP family transcriptional regulator n=1 Tax=Streptomyces sp. L-9-10 TaxID=1478131 RepID=UPI00101D632F|nr:tetratricopeptide repeat protein [Streptomyces sp. L-9-10]RYJ19687.1 SARP-family transcriptional regulator [Streptomyces sp. L-9-10]